MEFYAWLHSMTLHGAIVLFINDHFSFVQMRVDFSCFGDLICKVIAASGDAVEHIRTNYCGEFNESRKILT